MVNFKSFLKQTIFGKRIILTNFSIFLLKICFFDIFVTYLIKIKNTDDF